MSLSLNCPLCGSMATAEVVHNPYGKRIACPTCTEFFIDPSSERHIDSMPEVTKSECKAKLSKSAQDSGPKHLLVIREPTNDELGGDGHNVARTRMVAEWVLSDIG
jgi:hypothetical protein